MNEKTKSIGIHARMAIIKEELNKTVIPKSGQNKYAGFKYHELQDFMPIVNELNLKHGVNAVPNFDKVMNECRLYLHNVDNCEDMYTVVIPYSEAEMLGKGGSASSVDAIQRIGSTITYNRRYLYLAAYDIVENDSIDALEPVKPTPQPTPVKKNLNADQLSKAVAALQAGTTTVEAIVKHYSVTIEQLALLNETKTK